MHTILSHFDLTFTSGLISRFFVLYYSYLSSNVSNARPIPLGHSSRVCDISCFALKMTCDFQQCGILTRVDPDEPVQPPFKLRNTK